MNNNYEIHRNYILNKSGSDINIPDDEISVSGFKITRGKIGDYLDYFSKYSPDNIEKFKEYVYNNILGPEERNKDISEIKDKVIDVTVNVKKSRPSISDVEKFFPYLDDKEKYNIIGQLPEPKRLSFIKKHRDFLYKNPESSLEQISGKIAEVGSEIGQKIEKIDPNLQKFLKNKFNIDYYGEDVAKFVRDVSGSSSLETALEKTASTVLNPEQAKIFSKMIVSLYPPDIVASIIEKPSLINTILEWPVLKGSSAGIRYALDLPVYKKGGLSAIEMANKGITKASEYVTKAASSQQLPQIVKKAMSGEVPVDIIPSNTLKSTSPQVAVKMSNIKEITDLANKRNQNLFNVLDFLEKKGVKLTGKDTKHIVNSIFEGYDRKGNKILLDMIKKDKLTPGDLNNLVKISGNRPMFSFVKPEEIIKMSNGTKTMKEAIEMANNINKEIFENFYKKELPIQKKNSKIEIDKKYFEIKDEIPTFTQNTEKITPYNFKLKNPKQFINELDKQIDDNLKKLETKENISQVNDKLKLENIKKNIISSIFDQNYNLIKAKAVDLYNFYNNSGKIYWKARETIDPIFNYIAQKLDKAERVYSNYYIYYNSILEDMKYGVNRGLSNDFLMNKLVELDLKIVNKKFGTKYNTKINTKDDLDNALKILEMHSDYLGNLHERVNTIAEMMSNAGKNLLKESKFVNKEIVDRFLDRKFYFPYIAPEYIDLVVSKRGLESFRKVDQLENIFAPFLNERVGGNILPKVDVYKNFTDGLVTKIYAKEKFETITKTIKSFGLTEEELKNGVKDINRAKIISENTGIPIDLVKNGNISDDFWGLSKIKAPVEITTEKVAKDLKNVVYKEFYLPTEITNFLDNKVKSFTKTMLEQNVNRLLLTANRLQISSMLEMNVSYFQNMFSRDIVNAILTYPGRLTKTTGKIYEMFAEKIGKEVSDPDKYLRPLFNLDSFKVALSAAKQELKGDYSNKFAYLFGKLGMYSDRPSIPNIYKLKSYKESGDIIRDSLNYAKGSVIDFYDLIKGSGYKLPFVLAKNSVVNIVEALATLMTSWERFVKTYLATLTVPEKIKLSKLPKTEYHFSKVQSEIEKTLDNLQDYAYKYGTTSSSMLKGVTIDFQKFGSFIANIRPMFLFVNPQLQDMRNVFLFAKNNPTLFALRYGSAITSLTAYNIALQELDKSMAKKYGKKYIGMNYLPTYTLTRNLLIPVGEIKYSNGIYGTAFLSFAMPESFIYFNSLIAPTIAYRYMTEDKTEDVKEIYKELYKKESLNTIKSTAGLSLGLLPSLLFQFASNKKDPFSEYNVIPDNLKNLEPRIQYNENTENVYRYLGDKFNISPLSLKANVMSGVPGIHKILSSQKVNEFFGDRVSVPQLTKDYPENRYSSFLTSVGVIKSPTKERILSLGKTFAKTVSTTEENLKLKSQYEEAKNILNHYVEALIQQKQEHAQIYKNALENIFKNAQNNPYFEDFDLLVKKLGQNGKNYPVDVLNMFNIKTTNKEIIDEIVNIVLNYRNIGKKTTILEY